jgi:hypothetical protein
MQHLDRGREWDTWLVSHEHARGGGCQYPRVNQYYGGGGSLDCIRREQGQISG